MEDCVAFTEMETQVMCVAQPEPEPQPPQPDSCGTDEDGLGMGFMVDKINNAAYEKAVVRNHVPFAAFLPKSSEKSYLLKITDFDESNHLLEPALEEDVLAAYKQTVAPGSSVTQLHEKVAVVAFVRQFYNEESRSMEVRVESPRGNISNIKLMRPGQFSDFAFSPPEVQLNSQQQGKEVIPGEISDLQLGTTGLEYEIGSMKEFEVVIIHNDMISGGNKVNEFLQNGQREPAMPTLLPMVELLSVEVETENTTDCEKESKKGPGRKKAKRGRPAKKAVKSSPKRPARTAPLKKTIKREIEEDANSELSSLGLHTPEKGIPDPSSSYQETPCPTVKLSSRRTKAKALGLVKEERMDVDEDQDEECSIANDPTFAPRRPKPQPLSVRKRGRGRPRKIVFEEEPEVHSEHEVEVEGPKSKVHYSDA